MERRHQVFISSTFSDLKAERAEIVQALLELDCFPAGMELFPATSESAWDLIKGVIDDSDYYTLIIGGRYGSLDAHGISYTEKEYEYAINTGKPVAAFLHANAGNIPQEKCETSDEGREKLTAFRARVESTHHCKYWSSAEELGGKVSRAIVAIRKSHPSDGWVPGTYAIDETTRLESANLRARVAELEAQIAKIETDKSPAIQLNLASGNDQYETEIYYSLKGNSGDWHSVTVTWDQILRYVGSTLLQECTDEEFVEKLNLCFGHEADHALHDNKDVVEYSSVVIPHVVVDEIKVQLRALGYMIPGTKRRAVSDKKTYWKLSNSGEARLIGVQAIRKPEATAATEG